MHTHAPRGRWLALTAALLGWMFDGMEMGLFPLVGKDALRDLLQSNAQQEIDRWYGVIIAGFLVGAATGGVLFGWLGDKIGRVRAMTVSVMLYSLCSGGSAFAQEAWQLAVLRFAGALGMGGEWALGVALVMEIWPNKSRAWLAGWIGAFGNLGYTLVGSFKLVLIEVGGNLAPSLASLGLPTDSVDYLTAHNNWRLLMLFGAVPSLLTFLIRIFVPESERWEEGKAEGKTSHWSGRDLVGVLVGATAGAVTIGLSVVDIPNSLRLLGTLVGFVVVAGGFLYPVRKYVSRAGVSPEEQRRTIGRMLLAAGLSGVALLGTWAGLMWMYLWVSALPGGKVPEAVAYMQIISSLGAAAGCVIAAVLGGRFGRRPVYAVMCVLSAVTVVGFYRLNTEYGTVFLLSSGLLGLVTASFYGWLPLYLPELFPTAVRATGQGFGFNCGRVIAAVGSLQMPNLLAAFKNDYGQACALVAGVYVLGLMLIVIAPETKGKPLPE
ncbi:MFS transporter [Limnoglobus roseus]|uniref:MFS transporter n=1 Tax=Limnoglobus roseus TaxID=2598579 RepID=A0A5C1AGE6_9BACT|nr:MFS transporter [Limnoglobus roseus]QEL17900.1 MFS transporter [Limnoglobus roseus]